MNHKQPVDANVPTYHLRVQGSGTRPWGLPPGPLVLLGRDSDCQLQLDHESVSRHHAEMRFQSASADGATGFGWEIRDLGSTNGTRINGKAVQDWTLLRPGDVLKLGDADGPEFKFEVAAENAGLAPADQALEESAPASGKSGAADPAGELVEADLFPILAMGRELFGKGHLAFAIVTAVYIVALLMLRNAGNSEWYRNITGVYLAWSVFYLVYGLCGKRKPFFVPVAYALACMILMETPVWTLLEIMFRYWPWVDLPAAFLPQTPFVEVFITMLFAAGLMEELFKILPVLLAVLITPSLSPLWKARIGVIEPLDGIILAMACSVGFTLSETMFQYIPNSISSAGSRTEEFLSQTSASPVTNTARETAVRATGELRGLELLIPRVLGSIFCHIAFSGYLGYFIGLSVLKPKHRWWILIIGYLSAATIHAFWNSAGNATLGLLVQVFAGVLGYACLTAAILHGRKLSPLRAENFATLR